MEKTIKGHTGTARPRSGNGNKGRTGLAKDTVNFYFNTIKRIPLLKAEEEKQLANRVARGDREARKQMIEANLRLVINIAKRYLNRGFQFQDIIEEGNIGLIKSVERFKPSKGCRFSTYATYWIRQSIERAIANQSNIVRLPIHVNADLSRLARAARDIRTRHQGEPTTVELAESTGFSGRYIKKLNNIHRKSFSLDSAMPDSGEHTLLERLEDEKTPPPAALIEEARRTEMLGEWLKLLDENEQEIIRLRFGLNGREPSTLEVIGKRYGVTRERIRQIEVKALAKLKKIIRDTDNISSFSGL